MRPVTLDLSQVKDPAVSAALAEIQRASIDTLQNDTSSSGAAMSTLIGAAADEIAYFTGPTTTAFTALTSFGRSLLAAVSAAASLTVLGVSSFMQTVLAAPDAATARATLGTGTGTVTSIATTAPITGGTITTSGTIGFDITVLPMHLLSTLTASNSSTLDDTTDITATYDEYLFVLRNVVPATNNSGLLLRISTDGGATFKSTGYLSTIVGGLGVQGSNPSASAILCQETATTSILLSGLNAIFDGISNTTGGVSGSVLLHNPNSTSALSYVTGSTAWFSGGTARMEVGTIGGVWNTTGSAINAIRFLMNSGNITSGTIKVYGIKTS